MTFVNGTTFMANEWCYSNCSILIPRLIYSGGDLAAGIILMSLFTAGVSVVIHTLLFYWIYQKKLKPRLLAGARSSLKKDDAHPTVAKGTAANVLTDSIPVINRNQAYGKVEYEK